MTYRPYSTFVSPSLDYIRTNSTGVTINKGTPIRMNAAGNPDFVDPAIESQVKAIAAISQDTIANGTQGVFVTSGRVKELVTPFDFGDSIYLSKTGGLTNIQPSEGVGGFVVNDWVVHIGVIAKNESNPTVKDMIIHLDIIGQL